MSTRLYVGNLSPDITMESLDANFSSAGEIKEITMPTDRETGLPRGFAYVTMGSQQAATTAVAQLNGSMLDGRVIKVNEESDKPSRLPPRK